MQNKCQNCGHILSQGDIFCSRCGKKISEKPSAIQYAKINKLDEIPIVEHIGNNTGITKKIFADAEPINTCKINIKP